jgi:hypothetical protein
LAIADEIDALARRAKNDLDDLLNFAANIHTIWKNFKISVDDGLTLRSRNPKTRTEVTERDLIRSYHRYRTTYVQGLGFVQFTTVFEAFLFDFLLLLLANDPRHLAQKKQIEVGVALSAVDRGALILLIAERELNELKYDRPTAWFDYLNKIVHIGCPTKDEIERIAEMKAGRDLLIHNSGVVNKTYLDKAGTKARYAVGDKVVIDRPYFEECWLLTKKLIDDIATAAKSRLARSASP